MVDNMLIAVFNNLAKQIYSFDETKYAAKVQLISTMNNYFL